MRFIELKGHNGEYILVNPDNITHMGTDPIKKKTTLIYFNCNVKSNKSFIYVQDALTEVMDKINDQDRGF